MSMYSLGNDLYSGKRSFNIIEKRKTWYAVAAVFILLTAILLVFKPINVGIDFRGGSQFTISGTANMSQQDGIDVVAEQTGDDAVRVSEVGANSIRIQTSELTNEQTIEVRAGLAETYGVPIDDVASTFIGPTWGADVSSKALQ